MKLYGQIGEVGNQDAAPLFELWRTRNTKRPRHRGAKRRRPKEERDDRRMLAFAEPRAKPKAEHFYRPYGTDASFLDFQHFVLRHFH